MCITACVEVRGQFRGIRSFLPPCGSLESNSNHQAWWQAPLSVKPSRPSCDICISLSFALCSSRSELRSLCWQPGLWPCYWSCKGLNFSDCQTSVSGTKHPRKQSGRFILTVSEVSVHGLVSALSPGVGVSQWTGSWMSTALHFLIPLPFWSIWVPEESTEQPCIQGSLPLEETHPEMCFTGLLGASQPEQVKREINQNSGRMACQPFLLSGGCGRKITGSRLYSKNLSNNKKQLENPA